MKSITASLLALSLLATAGLAHAAPNCTLKLKGDKRVLAATKLVGGGGKTSTTLSGKRLVAGGDYVFFCSFPGHSGIMKGKLVVTR